MRWSEALNHGTRLADQGYDVSIQVRARSDVSVERTATIRVMKSGINDLGAFFTDAKNDGLTVDGPKLIGDEYFELN